MRKTGLTCIVLGLAAAGAVFAILGCEDEPGKGGLGDLDYESRPRTSHASVVTITPTAASLTRTGQQAVFRAKGGTGPYKWTTRNAAAGNVNPGRGSSDAVYTCVNPGPNNVTVTDQSGHTAIAQISGASLLIVPNSQSTPAVAGNTLNYTVTGGNPPYGVSLSDPGVANAALVGANLTYTVTAGTAQTNTITVWDTSGNTVSGSAAQNL